MLVALIYGGKRLDAENAHSANYRYRQAIRLELVKRGFLVLEVYREDPDDRTVLYECCKRGDVSFILSPNFELTKLQTEGDGPNVLHQLGTKVICVSDSIACNVDRYYKRVPLADDPSTFIPEFDGGPGGHKVDVFFHGDAMDISAARHIFPLPMQHFHLRSMCAPLTVTPGEPAAGNEGASAERDIDIMFCFSMRDQFDVKAFRDLGQNARALVAHLVDVYAVKETTAAIQDSIWEDLANSNVKLFEKYSYQHLVLARMVNRGVRDARRRMVLKALRKFNVLIVTHAKDNLGFEVPANWTVKPGATSAELQDLYSRSKIALNTLPAYGYGTTDRITTGMALGAVSLTDRNALLSNIFTHNQDILFYQYEGEFIEGLVADTLDSPERLKSLSESGKRRVASEFSLSKYVDDLLAAANGTLVQADVPFS